MKLLFASFLILFPLAVHAQHFDNSSGDAMQGIESRMPISPLMQFPSPIRRSFLPWMGYSQAPPTTVLNVQIQSPELESPPPPKPPAPAKFWTKRCGVFVELEVGQDINLMKEEQKDCAQ